MTYLPYVEFVTPWPEGFWQNKAQSEWLVAKNKKTEENERNYQLNLDACLPAVLKAASLMDTEFARLKATATLNIGELRALKSTQFEDEIARMFMRLGYAVTQTPYSNDGGRDAVMTKDGKKYLVECKCHAEGGTAGRPMLQKLHSAMITDKADGGFFITTGSISHPARMFAPQYGIELIDSKALMQLMADSKPGDHSTEYKAGCHQCGAVVTHEARALTRPVICPNGHEINTIISMDEVLHSQPTREQIDEIIFGWATQMFAPYGWSDFAPYSYGEDRKKELFNEARQCTLEQREIKRAEQAVDAAKWKAKAIKEDRQTTATTAGAWIGGAVGTAFLGPVGLMIGPFVGGAIGHMIGKANAKGTENVES